MQTPETIALQEAHRALAEAEGKALKDRVVELQAEVEAAEERWKDSINIDTPHTETEITEDPELSTKKALSMAYQNIKVLREQNKALHAAIAENVKMKKIYNDYLIPKLRGLKQQEENNGN